MKPLAPDPLADIGRGFADPVHATQQVFRCVLAALAHPGRMQMLPATALSGLQSPGPQMALWSVLLTLLDADTRLSLHAELAVRNSASWLRFHTGVRLVAEASDADFAALPCHRADAAIWTRLNPGSDEAPQDGATLLVEVDGLEPDGEQGALRLTGPGIAQQQVLHVHGLSDDFWRARQALHGDYPRGVDLLLCCGTQLVGLPRTTCIERG